MLLPIISNIILNRLIWPIDGTLTDTTNQNQSWPGSNGNEENTLYSLELQKWNLTMRCSLVSYPGVSFITSSYK